MGGMGGAGGDGMGVVPDANSRTGAAVLSRAKVITTSDKEIIGTIHIPTDFKIELDFGSLTLAPDKLRSITFTDARPSDKQPAAAEAASPAARADAARPASVEPASPPRYFRIGRSIIVISPTGGRVTLYDLNTKKSDSIELSISKDAPLEVVPIVGAADLVALMLKGPKVTRIAVASGGTWHSQALRESIDGQAVPIVAGVVAYKIGRNVYAYGAASQRWDVAEVPEGVPATPVVGANSITMEGHGHIFSFDAETGKWDHIDVRSILDSGSTKKK